MAVIETVLAIPVLLALLQGRKKKQRKGRSSTSVGPILGGGTNTTPGTPGSTGHSFVSGELEGTIQIGGTGDPSERYLPESYRMILDPSCEKMAVRLRKWDYDKWITNRYWELRHAGWTDPVEMTADILSMDSPQCEWPPRADSSDLVKAIWDWLFPGVEFYYQAEIGGTLKDYKWGPMPSVIPLVVWANPEREFSGIPE